MKLLNAREIKRVDIMGTDIQNSQQNPKVTVLMPVYNGERYLRAAIDSILSQTFTDFEFLIINDGSMDSSLTIIESYHDHRIRLINNGSNIKLIATLNKGLEAACGEYVARMDCDDISLPDRLERQVAFLESHPGVGICGTWVETIGEVTGDVWRYPTEPDDIKAGLFFESVLAHPAVMIRKALLEKHKLYYDPCYIHAEDLELWRRCSFKFDLANIPEVLLHYRISSKSVSRANYARQKITIQRIYADNFQTLGLEMNEQVFDLCRSIVNLDFTPSREFIIRAKQFLEQIQEANSRNRVYSEPSFSRMLAKRWFMICNTSAKLGSFTWKQFWNCRLADGLLEDWVSQMKFWIKCFFRWSPPQK